MIFVLLFRMTDVLKIKDNIYPGHLHYTALPDAVYSDSFLLHLCLDILFICSYINFIIIVIDTSSIYYHLINILIDIYVIGIFNFFSFNCYYIMLLHIILLHLNVSKLVIENRSHIQCISFSLNVAKDFKHTSTTFIDRYIINLFCVDTMNYSGE